MNPDSSKSSPAPAIVHTELEQLQVRCAQPVLLITDPDVVMELARLRGYSEDLSCQDREDILDEAEWILQDEATAHPVPPAASGTTSHGRARSIQ